MYCGLRIILHNDLQTQIGGVVKHSHYSN